MRVEHVLLTEGVGADIRNAMTLIGFNQRVINAHAVPFSFRQTLVIGLIDDSEDDGVAPSGQLAINLVNPQGVAVFALNQAIQLNQRSRKDVPGFTNIAMDVQFSGSVRGRYTLQLTWQDAVGEAEKHEISVYVVDAAEG
ncbi:hypothetical protein ACIQPR_43230 [Streptomyces sp. NPDC091280]|uniref:hypothetical protein n=1 Tax=Streptomyces sp. NPDC091280 TaxID=3365984 RepID=UPI00381F6EEC